MCHSIILTFGGKGNYSNLLQGLKSLKQSKVHLNVLFQIFADSEMVVMCRYRLCQMKEQNLVKVSRRSLLKLTHPNQPHKLEVSWILPLVTRCNFFTLAEKFSPVLNRQSSDSSSMKGMMNHIKKIRNKDLSRIDSNTSNFEEKGTETDRNM